MKKTLFILAILIVASVINVQAMTGVEYLSLDNNISAKADLLKPIIVSFVSQGYKNVPSWAGLGSAMEDLIRKNGYANEDVETIALEAAIVKGMTR